MHRFVLGAVLAFAAVPAFAQQTAGEVYKWTDANGVTHYSQTPPASGKFEHRLITSSGATAPTTVEAAAEAPANPQCTAARANLTALQAEGDVMQDSDGDGKPDRTLSADEHANQVKLAESTISVSCTS